MGIIGCIIAMSMMLGFILVIPISIVLLHIFIISIVCIAYIMRSMGYLIIFKSECRVEGWKAFVPLYSTYILYSHLEIIWLFVINIAVTLLVWIVDKDIMTSLWMLYTLSANGFVGYKLTKLLNHPTGLVALSIALPDFTYAIHGLIIVKDKIKDKIKC